MESLTALDRIFEWSRAHGLRVLLDLHGAPGSQNGADHSGCDSDGVGWRAGETIRVSLQAIGTLAQRYGPYPSLLGIELLNEPGWAVEWAHGELLEYYTRAQAIMRAWAPSALVVFNVLYSADFPAGFGNWWTGQLVAPNVVLDLHLYDCYGNHSQRTAAEHVAQARVWRRQIAHFQAQGHRVMVGEWSLATGVHEGGQAWASAQLDAFAAGIGWFFWNLKMEGRANYDDTWTLQGAIGSGITGLGSTDQIGSAAAKPVVALGTPLAVAHREGAAPHSTHWWFPAMAVAGLSGLLMAMTRADAWRRLRWILWSGDERLRGLGCPAPDSGRCVDSHEGPVHAHDYLRM